jgi:16S rRNA (adenine1518-N6/adenine1519-N6)-dimethyltransferase
MVRKELGQHWLNDKASLQAVADAAELELGDTVLEIGPGLGSLTAVLLKRAGSVLAVEFDRSLASNLKQSFAGAKVIIAEADFLKYDLKSLPAGYKVAANLPYYITAPILQKLSYDANSPAQMGLLVQKEVAERLSAGPGYLSVLAVTIQNHYDITSGLVVPAELFTPKPKVDSQIVSLRRRVHSVFGPESAVIIKLVKAGFSNKRKTLVNSLAATYQIAKPTLDEFLKKLGITDTARAQELSLPQWRRLHELITDA